MTSIPTAYDGLGWFYDRYWRDLQVKAMPALDRLLLSVLPRGARVLDLCCGAGHLAAALCRRGLRVTGLDGSEDMLRFARVNAPRAQFVVADARRFHFACRFDAVVSTYDCMNHLLEPAELAETLCNVRAALAPGGRFVFDVNLAEAFETQWHKSSTIAADDHLCYVRGRYDRKQRLAVTYVTLFRLDGAWTRRDLRFAQRCYSRAELRRALHAAGFADVAVYTARDLGMRGRMSVGRAYLRARSC